MCCSGIGENYAERVDAIREIRASAQRHGHVQEVIVQNFRAKPRTAMQAHDDLELQEYVAAVAVTRLLLGPKARVQAPPNLSDSTELGLLLRAGVDDWGGVSPLTPDHVNPERPWPNIDKLAALSAEAGFELRERLAAQPPYVLQPEPWLDPRVRPHVFALAGPDGLAVEGRIPVGPAVAGAGRVVDGVRADRPARRGGHRRADGGPAQRLRRRLRRLGRAPRPDDGRPRRALHRAGTPATARCWPRCCTPSRTRPG